MSKKNNGMGGLWTAGFGQIGATLKALENEGVTLEHLTWIRADPDYAKKVAKVMLQGVSEKTKNSLDQKLKRRIMGRNFFGIEEAIKYFGIKPTKEQISALAKIPFTEAELYEVRKTHLLVAVFPLSVWKMRGTYPDTDFKPFSAPYINNWYGKEPFANECGEVSWQLIRTTPVAESTLKTWDEQQKLLDNNEKTPTVRTMVYAIIGHRLMTGIWLFKRIRVRCSDVDSKGYHVDIYSGCLDRLCPGGIEINHSSNDICDQHIGLAVSRKISTQ